MKKVKINLTKLEIENRVKQWVIDKSKNKNIISFYPSLVMKELNIFNFQYITKTLIKLVTECQLNVLYHYDCQCDFSDIYKGINYMPKICPWCEKEIDYDNIYIEFEFKR